MTANITVPANWGARAASYGDVPAERLEAGALRVVSGARSIPDVVPARVRPSIVGAGGRIGPRGRRALFYADELVSVRVGAVLGAER